MTITVGSPLVQTCAQVFWMDVVRHTACRSAPSHGKCVSGPSAVFVGARPPTAVDGSCHCHGRAVCQCVCVCVSHPGPWHLVPWAAAVAVRLSCALCLHSTHVSFHGVSRAAHSRLWEGLLCALTAAHSLFGASALELLQHSLPTAPLTSVV